jgi:hypothetical protein
MNKSQRFTSLLIALAVLVAVSLACGSSTPTSEPAKISTATSESGVTQPPADTPTTEIPSTAAPAVDLYLGDPIEKFGYALTPLSVSDPATPGMFYQAEAGKKLVAVEVIISNVSGDVLGVNPLNASLLDKDGFVYQAELGGVDDQIGTVDLNPGEQVRGWISFKVSENATAAQIKYLTETFGSNFLQTSLTPPPAGHTQIILSLTPKIPSSKLGDVVEQFGDSLTANTVEDPATPGMLYSPKQDYKLVAVEITLGNVSGAESLSVNPLYTYLVDSNGFVYAAELGGRDGQINTADLNVGEKAKGWVSFTIPKDATFGYIKYQTKPFSGNFLISGLAKQ